MKDWCWIWCSNTLATDAKSQLIGKDPDAGKDWRQEVKVVTDNEMFRWHHQLNAHEFEQTSRDTEGRGAWGTAVHGSQRFEHNLVTEQKQQRWIPWHWRFPIACEKRIFLEMKLGKSVTMPDDNYWISVIRALKLALNAERWKNSKWRLWTKIELGS